MALDLSQIGQLIGIVGFPVTMSLLMWKARREDAIRRDEREKVYMEYIQNNTKTLQELCTLVKERLK